MKRYRYHKMVHAATITEVLMEHNKVAWSTGNTNGVETTPDNFFARGVPEPGDYLVKDAPDGYLSWSPKAVFEAGYREMGEYEKA